MFIVKNNKIETIDSITSDHKAETILSQLNEIPRTSSNKLQIVEAAEEVYEGFNRKLGWFGRAINWIKSLFGKEDHYIQKVDTLFKEISQSLIKIPVYINGNESKRAFDQINSMNGLEKYALKPIVVQLDSQSVNVILKTEHAFKDTIERIILMDGCFLSRADAFSMFGTNLNKKDKTIAIIVEPQQCNAPQMNSQWNAHFYDFNSKENSIKDEQGLPLGHFPDFSS